MCGAGMDGGRGARDPRPGGAHRGADGAPRHGAKSSEND
jgi:hypothetical protein